MLKTSGLYAYVPAHDVERCRAFYADTLGLGPGRKAGPGYTFECAKGTAFFVYPTPNAGTNQASCAFWQVDDVEAVVAWLKGRGVVFESYPMPESAPGSNVYPNQGAKAAWFKDTEGNIMAVVESSY
ncbi:putative enzyme related to lactoylglutathione lyase [Variovorax sp. SRS16]|uniref:VOC family protein n=1 Tax=Variovorax sp. SRS16 TaxID=282217 RepID=UPI001318B9AE|nr:VOC family protein [Variovorax sp. SRS16]VTU13819.1 putative enzyme related to lactoylglutathione lyase [Variovorax sp. SRS16]